MDDKNRKITRLVCAIILAIISALVLTFVCIYMLSTEERKSAINIITIVGTVLAVVGIAFTIYQQIQVISVTEAISKNTIDITKRIMDTHFEVNLICAIRCLDKMDECFKNDPDARSITIKLDDLHEHVLECRKLIEKYNTSVLGNNPNFTKENLDELCTADKKITRFKYLVSTSENSIKTLREDVSKAGFGNFIVETKRSFTIMKRIQYSI